MKKFIIKLAVLTCVLALAVFAYLLFTGPRMWTQPNIRPFQSRMPVIPKGSVPVVDGYEPIPTQEQAKSLKNPLPKTPENYARGKIYYGYYCAFCHGQTGAGDGPVGHSYIPAPADLRTEKVKSLSEGELLRAMLTGAGHEPVLQKVIPADHRWYLELYTRTLDSKTP